MCGVYWWRGKFEVAFGWSVFVAVSVAKRPLVCITTLESVECFVQHDVPGWPQTWNTQGFL